jgi:hypothetical protein
MHGFLARATIAITLEGVTLLAQVIRIAANECMGWKPEYGSFR